MRTLRELDLGKEEGEILLHGKEMYSRQGVTGEWMPWLGQGCDTRLQKQRQSGR